jgi:hypothetical protein
MINSIPSLVLAGWIIGVLVTLAAIFSVRMVSFVTDPEEHALGTGRWVMPAVLAAALLWPLLSVLALVEPLVMARAAKRLQGRNEGATS